MAGRSVDAERHLMNLGMHTGQAILLGAWRGIMAQGGLRGPGASAAFTVIRLSLDQTLENVTGQGATVDLAPPRARRGRRRRTGSGVRHRCCRSVTDRYVSRGRAPRGLAWR